MTRPKRDETEGVWQLRRGVAHRAGRPARKAARVDALRARPSKDRQSRHAYPDLPAD